LILRDIWDCLRYVVEPDPREYWKPPEYTPEEEKKLCCIGLDESGNAFGYNPAKQPHPAWRGNAKSRIGYLYNPYCHPLGKFLQGTLKGSLMKCINFVHAGILKYDPTAYQYDDPRLQTIETTVKTDIDLLFFDELERRTWNDGRRKIELMSKVCDIALFLMKEDIFYRWRFLLMLQHVSKSVEHFEPTQTELENLVVSTR
jgi:hypothetical protein